MRFLRLDFRDELSSIDVHPLLNVVAGLESNLQRELVKAVQAVADGATVGLRGLVEHQGLMVELNTDPSDALPPTTTTADVVVYVDRPGGANEFVGLQSEIDRWERQLAIDVVTVEEVRADLDPGIKARAADLFGDQADRRATEAAARRTRLSAIRNAVTAVNGLDRQVRYCPPEVLELIRRWDAYSAKVEHHVDHIKALDDEVIAAENATVEAKTILSHAQAEAVPVFLTAEEETRLEELCDVDEPSSKFGRLLGGSSNEGELEAEKQALLDKVGVGSWTEYSMFRLSPTPPKEKVAAVERAQSALDIAEETLGSVRWKQKTDPIAAELTQEMRKIQEAARPYLDPVASASVGEGLRAQIEIRDNPQWTRAVDQLRNELTRQGLRPEVGSEPDGLIAWARQWLATQIDQEADSGPADTRTPAEIEREKVEARTSLMRHRRALARIEAVEAAVSRSRDRLAGLRRLNEERASAPELSTAAEVLAMVEPMATKAVEEIGSSIPVVVVGEMPNLDDVEIRSVMDGLERLSARVQVILMSDRSEVADWVEQAGLERAGVTTGTKALI